MSKISSLFSSKKVKYSSLKLSLFIFISFLGNLVSIFLFNNSSLSSSKSSKVISLFPFETFFFSSIIFSKFSFIKGTKSLVATSTKKSVLISSILSFKCGAKAIFIWLSIISKPIYSSVLFLKSFFKSNFESLLTKKPFTSLLDKSSFFNSKISSSSILKSVAFSIKKSFNLFEL